MITHTALCISIFDPYISGFYVECMWVSMFYFNNDLQRPLQEYYRNPENLWVHQLDKSLQEHLGKKLFIFIISIL